MTAKENERLARLETHMGTVLDSLGRIEEQVSVFNTFRGKVIGGGIVGAITITALSTVIGAILYG